MPQGLAARLAAWQKRWPGQFGAAAAPLGGSSAGPVLVELFLGGGWVDISTPGYVRYADGVKITRGRTDEGRQVERGVCRLTLDNTDGRFSPRNPTGAYYGLIGRNTPLRVSVPYLGGRAYRFHGEVSAWPVNWDLTGIDVYVQVEASGILRRLSQGSTPFKSAPRRFIEANNPASYRHLEEGPLTPSGSIAGSKNFRYGVGELAPWLPPSLHIIGITGTSTGLTIGRITTPSATGWSVDFMYATDTDKTFTFRVFVANDFSFAVKFIASSNQVELFYTPNSTGVDSSLGITSTSAPFDNETHHVRFAAAQNGANIDLDLYLDGELLVSDTKTSVTNDGIDKVWVFPYVGSAGSFLALGHFAAWTTNAPSVVDAADAALGHQGEAAGRRIERLCSEENIQFSPTGDLDDTAPMGPQFTDTLVTILREAAETDAGILYEPKHHLGFGYRTRSGQYNQTPRLALVYTNSELAGVPAPVDDDQATRNDVTVTRREGESAQATQDTGPLSVLDPPDGVGRYDEQVTINVVADGFLGDQASWRVHVGTADEARYPTLPIHLQRTQINEGLRLNILDTDVGDRITLASPPAWLPPDTISVLVQGTSEDLDQFEHEITFNTAPESPYEIGEYGSGSSDDDRYDTAGSSLAAAFLSGTDTSMSVNVDIKPLWTTVGAEFPFDINVGGARLQVTAISGSSSPQTFTITATPVNGVIKTIPAGTDVRLWTPAVYGL